LALLGAASLALLLVGLPTSGSALSARQVPTRPSSAELDLNGWSNPPASTSQPQDAAVAPIPAAPSVAPASARAVPAADWALVCSRHPNRAIAKIRDAIASGALPRDQAVASARRIVALKSSYGLAPR